MRRCRSIQIAFFVWLAVGGLALACKYSVRDVGFIDLGRAYELIVLVDRRTPPAFVERIKKSASAVLADSNVAIAVVNADDQPQHSAVKRRASAGSSELPAFVLTASDGRALSIKTGFGPDADENAIAAAVGGVVESSFRNRVVQHALVAHSVVVVVEGTGAGHNANARRIAQGAIADVAAKLSTLPKPMKRPPVLVVLSAAEAKAESLALWSLGIDDRRPQEAHVVVIYGRARRLGSPLVVPGASQTDVAALLAHVGQDCECELDRTWMQGPMMPHRWDEAAQREAFTELGFDTESPLVKSEIRRILDRGPNGSRQNRRIGMQPAEPDDANDSASTVLGYQEMELPNESDRHRPSAAIASVGEDNADSQGPAEESDRSHRAAAAERAPLENASVENTSASNAVVVRTGLLLLVAAVSAAIGGAFVRKRSRLGKKKT